MSFLDFVYYGNSIQKYLVALAIALATFTVVILVRWIAVRRLRRWAERTTTDLDDVAIDAVRRTRRWIVMLLSLYAGSLYLVVEQDLSDVTKTAAIALVALQVGLWSSGAIYFWYERYRLHREAQENVAGLGVVSMLALLARVFVWAAVVMLVLDNLGIDMTTLFAGLGIGGLAIALAVKNVLSDLLSSFSIMLDKPFEVGDFIVVDDYSGTVEHIGIRSTQLRAFNGEQIVFGNDNLLSSRIRNYGRMEERRAVFRVRIHYGTDADRLERIPETVSELVSAREGIRLDRCHLRDLGESAVELEVSYWVESPEFALYMDHQQALNLAILRAFSRDSVDIGLPARTVHLEGAPAERAA